MFRKYQTVVKHELNCELGVSIWSLHSQLQQLIQELMNQLRTEYMVLWAQDRQAGNKQYKVSQCRKAQFRTVQNSSANLDGSPVQAFSLSSLTFATYDLANNRKLYEKSFMGSSCTAKKVWKRLTLKREKNWTLRHYGSRTVRALICWSTCSLRSATGHINQIIFLSNRGHSTFHYMLRKHDKDRRRVSQKQKD